MRSLATRISLLLIGAFLLVALIAAAIIAADRRTTMTGTPLPLPERVAAITNLIEHTPPASLGRVLAALNAPDLSISVENRTPPATPSVPMPGVTLLLRGYLAALGPRAVSVSLDLSDARRPVLTRWMRWRSMRNNPMRLVIVLGDGRSIVMETRDAMAQQFTGLRFSLIALLAALIIGAGVVILLRRQIRPLERLVAAVERFGDNREISILPEEGAREVRELTGAFNRLQSQIALLIAQRTRMMAAIGHDLGTYLTRLRLRADYIADADQRARAVRDIDDMNALMADTLAMAKLDHDAEAKEPVDLVGLAQRCASRLRDAAHLHIHCEEAEIVAHVRPSAIVRVIDNLVTNAIKYGGSCDLTLRKAAHNAEILVEDRGPGIPPERRSDVLEPFFRLDDARNLDQRGFGLGLAIVADIVRRHAGTLALEDRDGGGLRVRLTLPLGA